MSGYEYREELQQLEDRCKSPDKHTPEHSHGRECFAPDMCQEEISAPAAPEVHPVNGEVHVQDWADHKK